MTRTMRKILAAAIIGLLSFCLIANQASANPRYASFVMDADTGVILHQRYANKKLHPASLTKVMTLLLLFEEMNAGKIRPSDRIYISAHAASMVPSKLDLPVGSSIQVRDAISALVTKSANDVAVAVAEHIGGSEQRFGQMMTRRAQELGMRNTRFVNASGLHDRRQISTARDMAVMARFVIKNYPQYYKAFSQKSFNYHGKTYRSHNRLMGSYPGMDGMKTGYVAASGFNLIASAVRHDRRLIGVVFGGRSSRTRNAHMAKLLDQNFAKLPQIRQASLDIPPPSTRPATHVILASTHTAPPPLAQIETASGHTMIKPPPMKHLSTNTSAQLIKTAAYSASPQEATKPQNTGPQKWSIQIGAYEDKHATIMALKTALKQLPAYYQKATPTIAPLQMANNLLYRARLNGFTHQDASAACAYIRECITIAP